jgi:hypothetical protein
MWQMTDYRSEYIFTPSATEAKQLPGCVTHKQPSDAVGYKVDPASTEYPGVQSRLLMRGEGKSMGDDKWWGRLLPDEPARYQVYSTRLTDDNGHLVNGPSGEPWYQLRIFYEMAPGDFASIIPSFGGVPCPEPVKRWSVVSPKQRFSESQMLCHLDRLPKTKTEWINLHDWLLFHMYSAIGQLVPAKSPWPLPWRPRLNEAGITFIE